MIDTGSSVNIIGKKYLSLFNNYNLKEECTDIQLVSADGTVQTLLGKLNIETCYKNINHKLDYIISSSISEGIILGIDFLRAFKIKLKFGKGDSDFYSIHCSNSSNDYDLEALDGKFIGRCHIKDMLKSNK